MARTKQTARRSTEENSSSVSRDCGRRSRHYYRPGVEARKETRTYEKPPAVIIRSLQHIVKDMSKNYKTESSVKQSAIIALQEYLKSDVKDVLGTVISYKAKHVVQSHCSNIMKEEELNQLFRGVNIVDDDILPGDQRQM